VSYADFED
jgi:hypothetical protein